MKPHNPVKHSSSLNRVKLFINTDLAWLVGFPEADGGWVSVPVGQKNYPKVIDREAIRRATYTINKLRGDYPNALARLVGDVNLWFNRHQALINTLKPGVHAKAGFPVSAIEIHPGYNVASQNKARSIIRNTPELAKIVNAMSWWCWLSPQQFGTTLRWLDANRNSVITIQKSFGYQTTQTLLMRLVEIGKKHGKSRCANLLEYLSTQELYDIPTSGAKQHIRELRLTLKEKNPILPELKLPDPKWKCEVVLWIQWLVTQNDRVARLAIDYLALLKHSPDVDAWTHWWRLRDRELDKLNKSMWTKVDKKKFFKALDNSPPELHAQLFFFTIATFSKIPNDELHKCARRTLNILPCQINSSPVRLQLLLQWRSIHVEASNKDSKLLPVIVKSLGSYLESQSCKSKALQNLGSIHTCAVPANKWHPFYHADSMLIYENVTGPDIRNFYQSITQLSRDQCFTLEANETHSLIDLAKLTNSPLQCANAFTELKRSNLPNHVNSDLLELTLDLCNGELAYFGRLINQLNKHCQNCADEDNAVSLLKKYGSKALGNDFRQAVLDGHLALLHTTASKLAVVEHPGAVNQTLWTSDSVQSNTDVWVANYPSQLHTVLKALNQFHPDANSVATRILQKDFPPPSKVKKELSVLRQGLSNGQSRHIEARIKKLELWLKRPHEPSKDRLTKLEQKLFKAVVRAKTNRWKDAVDEEYHRYLKRVLKCETLPEWAQTEQLATQLMPLSGFKPSTRRLAFQVINNRKSDPPWDMRSRTANSRFLQSMSEKNIDMSPWIDDAPLKTIEHKGLKIEFTLERDPLEILSMGGHFQTCLSPGDFNYFSVFTNAADINKNVLYGRYSHNKRVVARCLLAMTDAGGLVKFHAYCHDADLNFERVSSDYVTELAKIMNTAAIRNGAISTLVAPSWYDDGVVDIADQFAALEDEELELHLQTCDLQLVEELLESAVSPLQLNELTVPHVLSMDVFDKRPDLVLPLFECIVRTTRLRSETIIRAAQLLLRCDRIDEVRQLMPRLIKMALVGPQYYWREDVTEILFVLLSVNPSKTLWLLKKTRIPGVRNWTQEENPERLYIAGLANAQLNRRKMATNLINQAVSHSSDERRMKIYADSLEEITDT